VVENKWRAQRYGVHGSFVDIGGKGAISVAEMLEQVIAQVDEDATALGCLAEVLHCRTIVGEGTAADVQLAVFDAAQQRTDNRTDAFRAVSDWIAETTLQEARRRNGLAQAAASSVSGNGVCTTSPRARASITPTALSASSVSVCVASRPLAASPSASGASGPTRPSIKAPTTAGPERAT